MNLHTNLDLTEVLGVREEKTVGTPKIERNSGGFGCERRKKLLVHPKKRKVMDVLGVREEKNAPSPKYKIKTPLSESCS